MVKYWVAMPANQKHHIFQHEYMTVKVYRKDGKKLSMNQLSRKFAAVIKGVLSMPVVTL